MTTYKLVREIPVEEGYDILVAGGGPAGSAAAICAARLGARVLLVEATGCLGGMGTSGLVAAFDPMADGERMLVGGFMREVVETLYERGFLKPGIDPATWRRNYQEWTPYHPEGLKLLLDELAIKAGVEVRFFTKVIDVQAMPEAGVVEGVVVHNIEGYRYIKPKVVIDCTGDAVLAALAGASCREAGRDTPRIMASTLTSLFANIDWDAFRQCKEERGEVLERAYRDGVLSVLDRHLTGMHRIGGTLGFLNGGHVFNLNALRCRELSDGMMMGRKIAQEYTNYYRKYIPGCERIEHVTTAALMGVRESRRIVGEYGLNIQDYQAMREFPDQIGVYNIFVDIHPYDASAEEYQRFLDDMKHKKRLRPGERFGIPYGVIVPKGWRNLWVAGRPVSADLDLHGAIRVQPTAGMMGQAAGTAAVQSIETGQPACDLDTERLIETLRAAGAYLPQERLSRTMTRNDAESVI